MTEKRFDHSHHCIELYLFLLLSNFTINRPSAVLVLQYKHILVTLVQDPNSKPHRLVLEFTFEFTKKILGIKEAYILSLRT